jgi:hypothetical protein
VTNDNRATLCARMLFIRRQLGDIERTRELLGQAIAGARKLDLGNSSWGRSSPRPTTGQGERMGAGRNF